ncbi:DUF6912 family protein [Luteococcus sp. Sow4_B9]|uniref:DUF6912 family protein n=1 Tax=Luteococcus sp. Sow4_B9 TaxID=3438792 RepID=UPI003F977632
MSTILALIPVGLEQVRQLCRDGQVPDAQAFMVNAALLEALDLDAGDDEEAEFGCMVLASVWGLAHQGMRVVLAAQVRAAQVQPGAEAHNGGITVTGVGLRQVQSYFADEDGQPLLQQAVAAARGLSLDDAWETDAVQELVQRADLLWHGVEELPQLLEADDETTGKG